MVNRNKNGRFTAVMKEEKPQMTMLSFSQAATYMGVKKPALKRIIESPKYSVIFNPDAVKVTEFHPDVPKLIEISQEALDAYQNAKVAGKIGARATRSGRDRKYTQYVSDARITEYQALMTEHGFNEAVPAYKAKTKNADATATATVIVPQDQSAPVDLVEDLIEA